MEVRGACVHTRALNGRDRGLDPVPAESVERLSLTRSLEDWRTAQPCLCGCLGNARSSYLQPPVTPENSTLLHSTSLSLVYNYCYYCPIRGKD